MTVKELNQNQLNELKVHYATELLNERGEDISYSEIVEATLISNDFIYEEYSGVDFTEDDFTSS